MTYTVIDKDGIAYKYNRPKEKCPLQPREVVAKTMGDMICCIMASDYGILYNPHEIGIDINRKDRERGRYYYNLRRCNPVCFNEYISFLRSKNKAHLTIAQRRFVNGIG